MLAAMARGTTRNLANPSSDGATGRARSQRVAESGWQAVCIGSAMILVWPDGPGVAIAFAGLVGGTIAHSIATR